MICRPEDGHDPALFGHAVDLLQDCREDLERRAQHRQRHGRCAVRQRLQGRVVAVGRAGDLVDRGHERGHVEGVRDLLGLEHRDRGRRIGRSHHEDARARADRHQRIARAADVEQRHRDLRARVGAEILVGRDVSGVRKHAAVGEHRALRKSGRARGVELHEAIARRARVRPRIGLVPGQPRFVLVVGAADADHALDARQLIAQLVDRAGELRPDEQQPGLGVVDHIRDLGRCEPEVDDRVRGADLGAGERQLQARRMVEVEHGDAVAGSEPRAAQGRRVAPDPIRQLGPGPVHGAERDRDGVRLLCFPVGKDRGEVGGLGHAVSSSAWAAMVAVRR